MMNLTMKLPKQKVIIFLCLAMWILPSYLYSNHYVTICTNLFGYFTILACVFDFIVYRKKPSIVFLLIFLSIIAQALATYLTDVEMVIPYLKQSIKQISIYYVIDQCFQRENSDTFLDAFSTYMLIMIFINFLTIVFFPNGLYTAGAYSSNYWMGYDNTHIRWQIPAIFCGVISSTSKNNKISIKAWLIIIISVLSNVIVRSGTALVALAVMLCGLVIIFTSKKDNSIKKVLFSPITSIIVAIGVSAILVSTVINEKTFGLLDKIARLLGKDSGTLTGRNYIWISSLREIKKNMIWGVGYENANVTSMKFVGRTGYGSSPHNICLETLYFGGIVLAVVTVLIYIVIFLRGRKYVNKNLYYICGLWLLTVSVMGLTEPQLGTYLRIAWIVSCNVTLIEKRFADF